MKLIAEDEQTILLLNICQSILLIWDSKKQSQSILPYIELMKVLGFWENTDNPLKPYNIIKSKEIIDQLARDYLTDISAETTAKQLSDDYLHGTSNDRRHA